MGGFEMYEWHGFGGGIMWVFWILLIAALIWAVISITGRDRRSTGGGKSALDILQERYAKGEIDREEFEQKRKDLSQ